MKTFYAHYEDIENNEPITLAIGNFDGLHIGHQNIIEIANSNRATKSAVMTFSPHPLSVILKKELPILMDDHDKEKALERLGVDFFFIVKFTEDFSKMLAHEFIEFLKRIHVKRIVVGRDFKFGYKGLGTIHDLNKHFDLVVLDDLLYQNVRVSTTYIKLLLENGDIRLAKKLLDRSYSIHGEVVHGDKVGKFIGYPTANIDYKKYFLPKVGIYACYVTIGGKKYIGCANLGHNPTLNYSSMKRLEVFILDYDGDLYHQEISVSFEYYLRDEIKYDNVDDLIAQIKKDVQQTIQLFKKNDL
ncbi:Riboflavin biosynthesis protein ribF [Acholeplasma oculi]|uniref:Riboflavin biosynthesis protein n=1 Tax=Acholeplasma oculi TaxID=35623 RepID=A0A061AH95_9MOLU|nr:bifunctional riboflavin kinase/FAD synthetase [Acholeplasma oculi]CDR30991.1 Riboflavin kinase/FMN adenylyltransferase [Acholeplasma oculi]SKC36107.1 riboflavin kinase / FMN adenylyltransferase [Acholeplasma oculi]SUT90399.1 Riboflavin biosynthesis protein ribF [Acholeplasma oculi]